VTRLDGAPALRLLNGLRDLPSYNASLGARGSMLATEMGRVLGRIEERTVNDAVPTAIVAQVGNGAVNVRCGKPDQGSYDWLGLGSWMRNEVREVGGYVLFDLVPAEAREHLDPWGESIPGLELMRRIKKALDPRDILSPGRFVGGI
ncbi:MAG TPA: FAD-linked oxidase C-terminal domain-containing protein, partial [Candidatus Acidoferrales bacterium]|nr:FAD-linked oxidase C-terminal domain-containing protein [Candidatus Acidoferrales bacterium]